MHRAHSPSLALAALISCFALGPAFSQTSQTPAPQASWFDRMMHESPNAISGNPAAESDLPGNAWLAGLLPGQPLKKAGLRLGGVWLGDSSGLLSGGAEPGKWSFNSALIVGANLDTEPLTGWWKGGTFGIQFLQFNGQNTNGQAGSVQGYNSIVATKPFNRSELYQVWFRQALFDDRLIFLIGKMVPTFEFNNLARPVPTQDQGLSIPSVTGLLFTPVFVNPSLLGAIPGYYDSASGLVVTIAPWKHSYLKYGFFDGNLARGEQTGMLGPQFNGYYFNIWEAGVAWVFQDKYPGQLSAGLWYQTGLLQGPPGATDNGTGGLYAFGSQRIWSHQAERPAPASNSKADDGKKALLKSDYIGQESSISMFFQYGINNSETLPINQNFGLGFTGFGLIPCRPEDSVGIGMSWAWLNPKIFDRTSELMFQAYYQAHLVGGVFLQPAVTYIPTPGAAENLGGAWALSFRVTVLF